MRKLISILLFPLKLILMFLVYFYKFLISPFLPKTCPHTPTCSTYALQALKKHGAIGGTILAAKRIARCTPNCKGGEDFVPINLKGEDKWLF
ncbi:MAG: membrane protein insertion efficiency factor YidD [Christensenellales bacterium]|jgi:putative membrane protein insertion efficiency factor